MSDFLAPDPASDLLTQDGRLGARTAPDAEALATAHRRAQRAEVAQWAGAAVQVVTVVWVAVRPVPIENVHPGDLIAIVASLGAGLLWVLWKLSAYRLIPSLGGYPPDQPNWMVVGGYLIPIISLWFPYVMMKEIREASEPLGAVPLERAEAPVGAWWAVSLGLVSWSAVMGFVPSFWPESGGLAPLAASTVYLGLLVVATLLSVLVIRRIDADQQSLGVLLLDTEAGRLEAV